MNCRYRKSFDVKESLFNGSLHMPNNSNLDYLCDLFCLHIHIYVMCIIVVNSL